MRAVRLTAIKKLELCDVPRPVPQAGQVLVAVKAVGICGSDVHFYNQGRIGADRCVFPQALGHECAGVVAEAAVDSGFRVGDRVAVEPGAPCYRCEHCLCGRYNICPNVKFLASPGMQGALQEFIAVDPRQLAKIPDAVSFDEAVLTEPLGVAYHTAELAAPRIDDTVAIFGAGPVGLLTLAVIKLACRGPVFIADRIAGRLRAARELFGAEHVIDTSRDDPLAVIRTATGGRGVCIAIEAAGVQETFTWAFESPRIGGKTLIIGIPEVDSMSFNPHTARRKELLVQNVRRSNRALEPCIQLVADGHLKIGGLATHHLPLEKVTQAFEMVGGYRNGVIKAIVTIE